MGRIAGYDRSELIRSARDLFWRRGFDAVSVAEVEEATGVGRSSIYHAFGNMRGLFDATVADYLDEIVRPRLRPLTADVVSPTAILDHLDGLRIAITALAGDTSPHGCLLLTSAATPIGDDAAVHQVISDYHRELSQAVANGIRALLPDTDDAVRRRLTILTTGSTIAALTLARVDAGAACDTLTAAIATLEDARDGRPASAGGAPHRVHPM
ncbi:TetR/AcrR family transcriptional regulator [Gordonia desulfuricans]|uniref:TetR/AcrR family transcriptional regulator n=1 Tax=Gordonia desulfuricans TaxID=89051 RepID=A0A7K3LUE7_9ACTN|nr:TetR/AcrR family transcriptional regulator [Gordonia desulfuricans]NDK91900.1 TetR/AcrR family transcriptional regulator [Gordonia desulfuricans]